MEVIGIIIIGILLVAIITGIFAIDYNKKGKFDLGVIFGLILSILVSIEVVLLSSILENPKPTAIDALMIYGVGSTLEYLKQNETAKELPDKCIDALDMWIEELNKKEKADE